MTSGNGQAAVAIAIAALVCVAIVLTIWKRRSVSTSLSSLGIGAVPDRARDGSGRAEVEATALVRAPREQRLAPVATRLEPASRLIGASGMVVWGVAHSGGHLEILAAQGYSEALLSRLGPLALHERVLTARACVERRVRTRPRRGSRLAGIAVPMERDERVIGVLTVEFDPAAGDRVQPDADAIVRLLAKQMTPFVADHQSPAHGVQEPPAVRAVATETLAMSAIPRSETLAAAVPFVPEPRPRLSLVAPLPGDAAAQVSPPPGSSPAPAAREMAQGRILAVPSAKVVVLGPTASFASAAPAPALYARPPLAPPLTADEESESAVREARSRFIAGFRKRCASIDELITSVEEHGVDGPLVALKQIVHRMTGLAGVVGLPTVGARVSELDRLLERMAASDIPRVRAVFDAMQEAFTTDLAAESPAWAAGAGRAVGAHVLLVTTDAPQAARMVEDLQTASYRVTLIAQGLRALSHAAADRPDLVLLDVELGGDLDGHDVCRRFKGDAGLTEIPIILVASRASTADRMAGFALGADDYLTKPVQTVEMLLRVRWTLTRPAADRQPAPRAGGGLMAAERFVAAAREVLRQGPAAIGLVRVAPGAMADLAAIFNDDLRRKDLLGRYSETQLAVLMPGATAGVAARRIGGVLDIARAAGLEQTCAGVTATGLSPDRFIEPMLAEAESALSAAHVEGTPIVIYGAGAAAGRGSVLIVDDDADVVHIIDARLKAAGLRTLLAFDGQQALHQVETSSPAVIVLELMLPKRSGFDVLARLRELPEPRPRIVVVSSRSREEDVMRAFELGADDYLTKPFNPQELLARLARLLK